MFSQLVFAELLAALPSVRFDLLVLTALVLIYKRREQDTVWDLSNRICDRYFPEMKHA
jgi:hypothetical protein